MTSITNNAEGGSDGTSTSTANSGGSSGTAWDLCTKGASATNEFDSAQAANGSLSYLIATGASSVQAHNRWTTGITGAFGGSLTTHYGRFYFRLAGLPAANRVLVEFIDSGVTTTRATFQMLTTGALRLRNAAGGTVVTFTALCSVDTWYRVEYRVDGSTTGAYEMHLFAGNSTSATESIVGGTANFGGTIGAVQYGYVSNGANLANLWFDGIQINDSALPGPELLSGVTPTSIAVTASLGSPTVSIPTAAPNGIAVTASLGSPTVSIPSVAPTSIAVTASLGSPTVAVNLSAAPTSVAVTASLGSPTVTIPSVAPDGIAVTASLGQPTVSIPTAAPDSVAVTATLGSPTVALNLTAAPNGIAVTASLGAPTVGSAVEPRNLQLTVGAPQGKWRAGDPRTKWHAGAPNT